MLGWLVQNTVGLVKETVNGLEAAYDYVADEIASIPDAATKGWDLGLSNEALEADAATPVPSTKFGTKTAK